MILLALAWLPGLVLAQTSGGAAPQLKTGRDIFLAACAACHGADGKGTPETTLGFTPPSTFPDFTDCNATSREPNIDWKSIIHHGGAARGFSEIMPSFREALTPDQIESVIGHLRGFCREPAWPRGELNLPRALVTEKAYLEDEAVLTTTVDAAGRRRFANKIVYERRFGASNQVEAVIPFTFQHPDRASWRAGSATSPSDTSACSRAVCGPARFSASPAKSYCRPATRPRPRQRSHRF